MSRKFYRRATDSHIKVDVKSRLRAAVITTAWAAGED